jgi:hypothetical protein
MRMSTVELLRQIAVRHPHVLLVMRRRRARSPPERRLRVVSISAIRPG